VQKFPSLSSFKFYSGNCRRSASDLDNDDSKKKYFSMFIPNGNIKAFSACSIRLTDNLVRYLMQKLPQVSLS
jgi:hypothetical protein